MGFQQPASVALIITVEKMAGLFAAYVERGPFTPQYEYHQAGGMVPIAIAPTLEACIEGVQEFLKEVA